MQRDSTVIVGSMTEESKILTPNAVDENQMPSLRYKNSGEQKEMPTLRKK